MATTTRQRSPVSRADSGQNDSDRPRVRRFTVAEYHKMGEIGLLDKSERLELIHGHIFRMSPIGSLHAKVVNRLNKMLSQRLYQTGDSDIMVAVQNPVTFANDSEPEPDLALLASEGPPGQHPTPNDILLIIEVADTSMEHDRNYKLPLYASAGIPEYWLVNLNVPCVDVYREPDGDSYARRIRHRADDPLRLDAIPDLEAISTGDLFPEDKENNPGTNTDSETPTS